ncbi:Malto-oligosyltrehalose trehalohydrolase [hydrothermal vent metagenome]|uniref:Malto-oligosyltrehalose trehalohydrolase n=1 Tax=hydrothermal vent metagenome TaxID=652676 RepID=A0A3B1CSJ5_9ZZZZ
MTGWQPSLGAWITPDGTRFRVWSPIAKSIDLIVEPSPATPATVLALQPADNGYFTGTFQDLPTGTRYRFSIDNRQAVPDPASRYQPEGVHGPSEVVDASIFQWTDTDWTGLKMEDLILYELHVGTFTPQGTFNGVREKLNTLKDLGITAIELMPVADFPGNRNWGYDGVDLFAPARCYGTPDEMRLLVNEAHALNIGVFLDVVYNHLGPDGAYLGAFYPHYFSSSHKIPWGNALNFDNKHSRQIRNFFIENALHWIHEYHIDGLRMDATQAMVDFSPTHILKEFALKVHASSPKEKNILLIAEDDRNQSQLILPVDEGGYGLNGVWTDDFHHQMRRLLTGDDEGFFQDFSGTVEDLARTLRQGWFYTGQHSAFRKHARGTSTQGIPAQKFIHSIQNHDQIGNRAQGDRLHIEAGLASFRAMSALFLLSPATPLIFMGQEWGADTPFCYFTDHPEALGKAVAKARRNEFRQFKSFSEPTAMRSILDPQKLSTFVNSQLNWQEREQKPHAGILALYRELINLRKTEPALQEKFNSFFQVEALSENSIALKRLAKDKCSLLVVACLKGQEQISLGKHSITRPPKDNPWTRLLTTEDANFTDTPSSPETTKENETIVLSFNKPCTVIFRATKP